MQQPLPTSSQPNPLENRCPGFLTMQLEGTPVQPDRIDLHLTIHFNEQCESLPGGSVAFGLKRGELKLRLENGKIPYDFRELTGSVQLVTLEESQDPEGSQAGNRVQVAEGQASDRENEDTPPTEGKSHQFQLTACEVTTKGSQKNPAWVFQAETGELVLKGSLKKAKLANLKVLALPCSVEATFDVSLRDIYISDIDGLLPENINRNQMTILEKGIAQLVLKRKLKPYLSRVELRYE